MYLLQSGGLGRRSFILTLHPSFIPPLSSLDGLHGSGHPDPTSRSHPINTVGSRAAAPPDGETQSRTRVTAALMAARSRSSSRTGGVSVPDQASTAGRSSRWLVTATGPPEALGQVQADPSAGPRCLPDIATGIRRGRTGRMGKRQAELVEVIEQFEKELTGINSLLETTPCTSHLEWDKLPETKQVPAPGSQPQVTGRHREDDRRPRRDSAGVNRARVAELT